VLFPFFNFMLFYKLVSFGKISQGIGSIIQNNFICVSDMLLNRGCKSE
jgi:hypothetical protein